jgi:fructokinase
LNNSAEPRLGIDLGGTKIEGVLMAPDGTILDRSRLPTPIDNYEAILDQLASLANTLDRSGKLPLGIGTPGSVSRNAPAMRNSNSTCLNGKDLQRDIESRSGRPTRIANDADCFTLSEASDGAASDSTIVFGVILGTGVGGGIVANGSLLQGINGITGEWGHNPVSFNTKGFEKRKCFCGRENCNETFLSGPGLARSYLEQHGEHRTPEQISDTLLSADKSATETLDLYCDQLAISLSVVINIIDPEAIVLGGGLSNIDYLYETIPTHLPKYVFSDQVDTRIVRAVHGDSSGVRGAAWLWP